MEHLAYNSNGKINIGISPLVQLWMHTLSKIDDAILFSDICEEMKLSRFVLILVPNRLIFHLKYI